MEGGGWRKVVEMVARWREMGSGGGGWQGGRRWRMVEKVRGSEREWRVLEVVVGGGEW